jgi:hypothetical protein
MGNEELDEGMDEEMEEGEVDFSDLPPGMRRRYQRYQKKMLIPSRRFSVAANRCRRQSHVPGIITFSFAGRSNAT